MIVNSNCVLGTGFSSIPSAIPACHRVLFVAVYPLPCYLHTYPLTCINLRCQHAVIVYTTMVYLSLSGRAPAYLAADCQLVSDEGRRQLRSAASRTCVVRRTYSNYGDRCFVAAGPKLWNSLPAELRQADISFQRFKRLLKTFLFRC